MPLGRLWVPALLVVQMAAAEPLNQLRIGVVDQSPEMAQVLGATVEAVRNGMTLESARKGDGEERQQEMEEDSRNIDIELVTRDVEPGEPLALAAALSEEDMKEAGCVVCGGSGVAASLGAGAAARSGATLLLVGAAPDVATQRASLALYPTRDLLLQVCRAVVRAKGWRSAVLLHEGEADEGDAGYAGHMGGDAVVGAALAPDGDDLVMRARRLPPPHSAALLRNLLLVLKKSGAVNFIVWCSAECSSRVLEAAQRAGLLAERHSYLIMSLDLHTKDLAGFSHGGANITGVQLFEPNCQKLMEKLELWRSTYVERLMGGSTTALADAQVLVDAPPTALLLALDGATHTAMALHKLALPSPPSQPARPALHADTLLNYLRSMEWDGVTGRAAWEEGGGRSLARVLVTELQRGGELVGVARWDGKELRWNRTDPPDSTPPQDDMRNRTFTVIIAKSDPYVMRRESTERLSGNDRYEGFCIELIERLSYLLNFNYTFEEQEDSNYGSYNNETKEWNGMMKRLMDDEDFSRFAITDLTITAEREQAVDFTTPFMNLGISILFQKPQPPEPAFFAFMLPFSRGVWVCLGLAYLGTSLVLYVVGRLCPEEWQNPYPCIEDPPALENQFTLANALWFNLGAVLLQGSEIAPVAYGTRAVASVWWFFALVITSSYTANLATLLAKKSSTETIHRADDLVDNDLGISYGAKAGGSTYTFFEQSQNELFRNMSKHMSGKKMPLTNEDGIKKVMTEKYAFLMESTTIEYVIERNCNVTKINGLLDSKGYGIAMKKGSPYRQALNLALLNLQEAGILREMKNHWWNEMHGGGACEESEQRENEKLSLRNFLGLFLVLVVGCVLGVVGSCADLVWAAWRRPRDSSLTYSRRLWSELRFVFRFDQSVKPLHGPLTPPPSTNSAHESAGTWVGEDVPEEVEAEERGARGSSRRSGSGGVRLRRSSLHAADLRLARHTRRDSTRHDRNRPRSSS